VALLLIDVVNDFEFPDAEQLFRHGLPAAQRIAALKRRRGRGVPVV
jgi:nicotinamidase-related amidase